MRKLKLFLEFNDYIEDKVNQILQKITKNGIESLTTQEKKFLDSQSKTEVEVNNTLQELEKEEIKENFKSTIEWMGEDFVIEFDFEEIDIDNDGVRFYGTIYLPDYIDEYNYTTTGDIKGFISMIEGVAITSFEKDDLTDYDFIDGAIEEYRDFIEGIGDVLIKKLNIK